MKGNIQTAGEGDIERKVQKQTETNGCVTVGRQQVVDIFWLKLMRLSEYSTLLVWKYKRITAVTNAKHSIFKYMQVIFYILHACCINIVCSN